MSKVSVLMSFFSSKPLLIRVVWWHYYTLLQVTITGLLVRWSMGTRWDLYIEYSQIDNLGPGLFNDIIEQAKNLSVEERIDLLENCEELAQIHASAANEGQTEVKIYFYTKKNSCFTVIYVYIGSRQRWINRSSLYLLC